MVTAEALKLPALKEAVQPVDFAPVKQPASGSPTSDPASSLSVEQIDPTAGTQWDDLVARHPLSTCFHSSAWARVLVKTYAHRPFYLRIAEHGELAALLPVMEVRSWFTGRRGVSLPFSDHCQPLLFGQRYLTSLLPTLRELAQERQWRHLDFRSVPQGAVEAAAAPSFFGHILDLSPGADVVLSSFASAVRRAIRKGESSGLTVRIERTREAMEDFEALHGRTRRRHGVPPQPSAFFKHIYEEVIKPGHGFVALARRDSTAVAAAVFFTWEKRALYKFGASNETGQTLRANNLVMWEAIKHLTNEAAQQLDFGRTGLEHEGLRRFKLSWGTIERALVYSRYDVPAGAWAAMTLPKPGLSAGLFRSLPLALNRLAGRLLYPHLD